jgi:Mrp family chromosome partitioning ATPase
MRQYRHPSIADDLREERWNATRGLSASRRPEEVGTDGSQGISTNVSSHASASTQSSITLDPTRIDPHLVTLCDSDPAASEEYTKLVGSLVSLSTPDIPKRLLITSAKHGEGRTSVVLNLAGALAKISLRVLVLDSDLARPSMLRLLGAEVDTGFPECLRRGLPLTKGLVKVLPFGFSLLPNRMPAENSVEVLRSAALQANLDAFERVYDVILFDSPPLLASPDAQMLLSLTDKCVFVIRPGLTTPQEMAKALGAFKKDDFVGAVLNRSVALFRDE